jgi:glycerophosphoryl diester phosphodiesterase
VFIVVDLLLSLFVISDKTLIISKYGASGDYPACTDLAYSKAISDGVDVLDCPVQISKDGTPFCLNSIDLLESTTVAQTSFSDLALSIPQIQHGRGIFTFNLTWSDIKGLTRKSKKFPSHIFWCFALCYLLLLLICIAMKK